MQVKMFKLLTTTVLQTIKKTSFSIQKSAVVNAALTCRIALQLLQTFSTADANAIVGKMQIKMLTLQTKTVSQKIKKTSFSMQKSAVVNAESICQIALQLNQTS
jgi:hypothetical protein